jgi:hypothetical protein
VPNKRMERTWPPPFGNSAIMTDNVFVEVRGLLKIAKPLIPGC